MELKETLDPLNDLALTMPGQVAAVVQESEVLEKRVEALLATFDQKRNQAREVFEQAEQALVAYKEQGDAQKEELATRSKEAEEACAEATDFLRGDKSVTNAGHDAAQALDDLADVFTEAALGTRESQGQASAAVGAVGDAIEAGRGDLAAAMETVATEAANLAQAADDARTQITERGDALQQQMTDLLQRAQARIGALLARLGELQSAHEGVLERETAHLESRCQELVDEVRQRVDEEVATMVGAGVADIKEALTAWSGEMEQAQERAEGSRQQVDAGVAAVVEVSEPLPAAVDAVRGAADQVGVSFG